MEKYVLGKSSKKELDVNFSKALENKYFAKICKSLDLPNDTLKMYTSSIVEASKEFENCNNCMGLDECPNSIKGCLFKAFKNNLGVVFSYVECKHTSKDKFKKNVVYFDLPKKLKEASFSLIYRDDKSRVEIIKKLKAFYDSYLNGECTKGIYLYGNFGCGKSYLIAALFNELAKKGVKSIIVHTPELLRSIKDSFDDDYSDRFNEVMNASLLLLDDIGAEYLTAWARDEVIEPILQYRMDQELPTFFTSNYSVKDLENRYVVNDDKMKAKRIIERINQVSIPVELVGENRRK